MVTLNVHIKHAGKVYDLPLNTDAPGVVFKESIYQVTGVPVERMKVMVKGGVLKNDGDWNKIGPKDGQTFMVIGAAGELPKPPSTPIKFLEDMDESEQAQALSLPVGLKNLGNTCYMNATLQTMRAIPELQAALDIYKPGSSSASTSDSLDNGPSGSAILTRSMADLYTGMRNTGDPFNPLRFWTILRQVVPQFGETHSVGGMTGFAQQDAEEAWVQITNALYALPGLSEQPNISNSSSKKFVEQHMMGEMRRELKCDEAPEEEPTITLEKVLKIECNISVNTNFMHSGILDALNQKIEKNSPSLGRTAVYTQNSRLSRVPTNLTVHMVRFAWKRDINKKAKIMRRVKFPLELDALDLVTDDLKEKLLPVNTKLKEYERDRAERRKVRKRTKAAKEAKDSEKSTTAKVDAPVVVSTDAAPATDPSGDATMQDVTEKAPDPVELGDESEYRKKEKEELESLISPDLRNDIGCSVSGLYELVGIVTHKGAAADSGHYIGFVKKSAIRTAPSSASTSATPVDEDDEDWYKFDDDKVSIFPKAKLPTLEGGGEDSSAYVLLYRSKSLA